MIYIISLLIALVVISAYISIYYYILNQKITDNYLMLANKDDFFKQKPVMRMDEGHLYRQILGEIDETKYLVIPQAPLTMFIDIKTPHKDHENLWYILGKKSVDFLIVDKLTMKPVKAIELNGGSHLMSGRKNRDAVVKSLLDKIGIPLETRSTKI